MIFQLVCELRLEEGGGGCLSEEGSQIQSVQLQTEGTV